MVSLPFKFCQIGHVGGDAIALNLPSPLPNSIYIDLIPTKRLYGRKALRPYPYDTPSPLSHLIKHTNSPHIPHNRYKEASGVFPTSILALY